MAKWQSWRYRLAHSRDIKRNRWNNVCPACGQRKFSPYIDTVTDRPLAEKVCGRCCREKNCAYHMTPSEWFKDNPPEKREWLPKEQYIELMRQRSKEARVAGEHTKKNGLALSPLLGGRGQRPGGGLKREQAVCSASEMERAGGEAKMYYERMSTLCTQTRSDKNHLARWLCTRFPEEKVAEVLARYRTGSTRDGRIIYWQIDECGQVHAGKVMAYDTDGHRRKEGRGNVCWVHSLKIDGIRFDEMLAPQCLFGLHLIDTRSVYDNENDNENENCYPLCDGVILSEAKNLAKYDDVKVFSKSNCDILAFPLDFSPFGRRPKGSASDLKVRKAQDNKFECVASRCQHPLPHREGWGGSPCIVESEKTALIMSLMKPDIVWLATGGKQNFKEQMLAPLVGLEVTVYPDADALQDWYARVVELNRTLGTRLHIPTWYYDLMNHDEPRSKGWDLADVVMGF